MCAIKFWGPLSLAYNDEKLDIEVATVVENNLHSGMENIINFRQLFLITFQNETLFSSITEIKEGQVTSYTLQVTSYKLFYL